MNATVQNRTLRYAVIGAGMAGVLAAIRLKQKGETFVVYEKAASLGGTWRENRYPGLTCDVPAHAYTYSFEPHPDWSAFYAGGPEIRAYFEETARKHGVMEDIRFDSEVVSCRWEDATERWAVRVAGGEEEIFDIVIVASGVLHHPRIPEIPGLDSFAGDAFHSARWNDAARIDGARVGVIGTGSTGVQLVTAISERAKRLVHFQRSPQWIMPVVQFPYTDEQRAAFRADPALIDEIRDNKDYWEAVYRFTRAITNVEGEDIVAIEKICRDNLEQSVRDPVLREKLRPDYRATCKRLIYSWSYYDAAQRPNVEVEREAIERVEPAGVRLRNGALHELDTLVLATGFHADRFIRPTQVMGRGGVSLDDSWHVRPSAYYAIAVPEYPNMFMLNGPTGPIGNFSLIDIAERQWAYIDQLLDRLRNGSVRTVEPRPEAFEAYEDRRIAAARKTIFGSGCTSWYLDATGVPSSWPWSYEAFAEAMSAPVLADYAMTAAANA